MILNKKIYQRILNKQKELDSLRPFPKEVLKRLKKEFNILLTYNSNAIEGNTLTLSETRLVVEEGITIGGKSLREHYEAINHQEAIAYVEKIIKDKTQFTEKVLCKLHAIILDKSEHGEIGKYRKRKVWIAGAHFVPAKPDLVPKLMKEFLAWLKKNPDGLNPLELAFIAHEKFVYIHPFIDGNGRVGRLLTSLLLMKQGYPPLIVLKTERKKYINVLKSSHDENYVRLVNFMGKCLERSLAIYLDTLKLPQKEEEYITLKEATKYCDYSQEYLSLLARKGTIGAVKLRRNWRITRKDLKEYLESIKKKRSNAQSMDFTITKNGKKKKFKRM